MITFYVTKGNNKNIVFLMTTFNSEKNQFKVQNTSLSNGTKAFFTLFRDNMLTKNTPVQVINRTTGRTLASGYAHQLVDFIFAEKTFLIKFGSKGFGLMVPINIFNQTPAESDDSIKDFKNIIRAQYKSLPVEVVIK